jgi:hypothetical protein
LRFAKSAIILTDQRVLYRPEGEKNWSTLALEPGLSLKLTDHAGVGCLVLSSAAGQLAVWRFTLGLQAAVARWVAQFEIQLAQTEGVAGGQPLQTVLSGSVCPVCQTVMADDQEECPSCGREDLAPPSTWTLLKLWRFARPYKGSLLAGFLLTLAATAATGDSGSAHRDAALGAAAGLAAAAAGLAAAAAGLAAAAAGLVAGFFFSSSDSLSSSELLSSSEDSAFLAAGLAVFKAVSVMFL